MYAVIRTGGKQARVAPGDSIRVEKLEGTVGDPVELSEVLLVGNEDEPRIGTPLVEGAKVVGTILAQDAAQRSALANLFQHLDGLFAVVELGQPGIHRHADDHTSLDGVHTNVVAHRRSID